MEKIVIAESKNILFETTLELQQDKSNLVKVIESSEELIKLLGKVNKVALGIPYFQKLNVGNKNLSTELKNIIADFDFHFVSLSCSFLPNCECKFIWAQLEIELIAIDENDQYIDDKPIAWDIFPKEVTSEISYKDSLKISPELGIKLGVIQPSLKLFEVFSEKNYFRYEPQLFSFGYRTSNIAWQFRETEEKDIRGDIKDLIFIVKTPKGSKVKARFKLSAEVVVGGKVLKLSKKGELEKEYELSK